MAILDFWESKTYDRVDVNGVRHYDIDSHLYPSVTQITSFYGSEGLKQWRQRVGEEEASRICDKASANGTDIHQLCEEYLLGNNIDHKESTQLQRMVFSKFKSVLNNISKVHLLENTLYSHKLCLAGTVDCVGTYDNVLSVIDFKTAKTEKPESWIEGYFVQTAIYAMCVYEMYGIKIKQVVILFACSDLSVNVVIKPITKEMIELVKTYITHYRNHHENQSTRK